MPLIAVHEPLPSEPLDYLIIGAGSAGCALAGQLAEDSDARILMAEAGGANREWAVKLPARGLSLVDTERFDWGYRTEPDASRGGKVDLYYRGKGLGGSSAINGMVYVQGAPVDFDRWQANGADGWGWDEVGPVYRNLEAEAGPRRGKGSLRTRKIARPHPTTRAFLDAAAAAGIARLDDYNSGDQEGVALIELTQRRGFRVSSADAFLRPALAAHRSLWVAINCEADRLAFDGMRVTGAWLNRKGAAELVKARHVILCAGSINSPKLLMLSGIGDAPKLRALGIDPILDNAHVGANLREHPLVRLQYNTSVSTYNDAEKWHHAARHMANYALHGEGPLAGVFEAIGFFRSSAARSSPDLQLHFLPIAIRQDDAGKLTMDGGSGVTVYVNHSYPSSTGSVELASSDPRARPIIRYNLVGNDADVDVLIDGMARVQAIMARQPMAAIVARETMPGFAVDGDRDRAREYVRASTEPAYHPIGTCAMGSGNSSVVSPRLKVNGVEGLWIADASIMPDLISGNTNGTCMMIGDRLGRWLREGKH
ncbi:GMC family oxidoreductase [Sphingosinicella microcystinivorans]|uniref:GMC family oxidoreductase n=1 Tax=Sphingosinicella microcystinivorans TaxID=335406 RepID=UPI0022F39D75|nr:GMC family oxidoreductase N-terminal domain-containing protein [Sphingosinicella microcystinivorans]WBX84176.1 GMC family oxidoreductase N-terminal domain-containing protein [Sphingosinicella microcystinivorans]